MFFICDACNMNKWMDELLDDQIDEIGGCDGRTLGLCWQVWRDK